jgi:hypothetical protein
MSDYGVPGTDDWDEDVPTSNSNNAKKADFPRMKLEEGVAHEVRLVGKPYVYYKYYANSAPIEGISPGKDNDVVWQAGPENGGAFPRKRYAIWLFDRKDNNELKILEFGPTVYKAFKKYKDLKKVNPGSRDKAPNWIIEKTIPEKYNEKKKRVEKNPLNTEYSVIHDEVTPLTEEEIAKINSVFSTNLDENNQFNWAALPRYRPLTPETVAKYFEESKTLEEGEPVPGSWDYNTAKWNERNAEKQNRATPDTSTPEQASADDKVTEGYQELFDGDDKGEEASTGATAADVMW